MTTRSGSTLSITALFISVLAVTLSTGQWAAHSAPATTRPAAPAPSSAGAPPTPALQSGTAADLLRLVNAHRAGHRLPPVAGDPALAEIARGHSARMAQREQLFHNDALFTRATHHRLGIAFFGENVAVEATVEKIHRALLNSPHHHENIDNARFTLAGFAVVRSSNGDLWATEDFGSASSRAPALSAPPARIGTTLSSGSIAARFRPAPLARATTASDGTPDAGQRFTLVEAPSAARLRGVPLATGPAAPHAVIGLILLLTASGLRLLRRCTDAGPIPGCGGR